jgi:hypothetical protein
VWAGTNFNGGTWTAPSQGGGYTLRVPPSGSSDLAVATVAQATAGSSGAVSGTCGTSGPSTGWLTALLPVPASGPPPVLISQFNSFH